MGRYVRIMQLMLSSMASFSEQANIVDLDQTALRTWIRLLLGEQFNPDPHCLLQKLDWNNLAEHIWRFAGVLMMAQHCWLSSFLIFQGILISIAKKPYISYDFSGEGGPEPLLPPPSGSAHEYSQLMLDPDHKFLSTSFRRAKYSYIAVLM